MTTIDAPTKFWLLGIAGGSIALHLSLSQQFGRSDWLSCSLLFWVTVVFLMWQKRDGLNLKSDAFSSFAGMAILALVLYRSVRLFEGDFFLRIFPLVSLVAWGLFASGIQGLKQYYRELFLLAFLAIPWEFIYLFDLSLATAKFSTFILWGLGFEVTRQGVWVILPAGSIEVYDGCSGVRTIFQLLGLSWIVGTIVPTTWKQKIFLPIVAILIGFTVNGVRVALMAVLLALSDIDGFTYWHVGNGSLIFSAIAVLVFACICTGAISRNNRDPF